MMEFKLIDHKILKTSFARTDIRMGLRKNYTNCLLKTLDVMGGNICSSLLTILIAQTDNFSRSIM